MEAKILLAGLLMVFGATAVASYVRIPQSMRSPLMSQPLVALLANLGGIITGFYSVYFLGSRLGWLTGIGVWAVGGVISGAIIGSQMGNYWLIYILGLIAMPSGLALAIV
jgi:dolichyl-phosphate-mannose--protein O-mannosyl transferase